MGEPELPAMYLAGAQRDGDDSYSWRNAAASVSSTIGKGASAPSAARLVSPQRASRPGGSTCPA